MTSPRISLCMIVKNESQFLGECLRRASTVVDQMVVVDTGSEDQTPEIALKAGAEVYHHPWEGSFSKARNQSLSYATGDWILILDGDELLDEETLDLFQTLDLSVNGPEAYLFKIINFTTDRVLISEAGLQDQVRLFKHLDEHGYSGNIHNQIVNLKTHINLNGPTVPIKVLHYGYIPSVWAAQNKDERLTLLLEAVKEDPKNLFVHYNLANHLKILKSYDQALEHFLIALEREQPTLSWYMLACVSGAFCANQLKHHEIAISLSELALSSSPYLVDAYLRRAEALIALHRLDEVIEQLSFILAHPQRHVMKQKALYFYTPYRLGRCFFLKGQYAEALPLFLSLAPQTDDITVFTHLSLCCIHNHLLSVYERVRAWGMTLDPNDPDWELIERVAQQHTESPPIPSQAPSLSQQALSQQEVFISRGEDDPTLDLHTWSDHFNRELEEAITQGVIPQLSLRFIIDDLESKQLNTTFNMSERGESERESEGALGEVELHLECTNEGAHLLIKQDQQLIYYAPERYLPPQMTVRPLESVLLLYAHLKLFQLC